MRHNPATLVFSLAAENPLHAKSSLAGRGNCFFPFEIVVASALSGGCGKTSLSSKLVLVLFIDSYIESTVLHI